MEYFWTHKDHTPSELGYGQFTPAHFILIGASVLFIIAIILLYKKAGDKKKIAIRRGIGIRLIAIDVMKLIAMHFDGVDVTEYLPLEICSFAAYAIVLDSFMVNSNFFNDMLMLFFLPGAIMPLFFPTTTMLPIVNFFSIHQFVYHFLIVAYVLMRFVCGEIRPSYKGIWTSMPKILGIVAVVYVIDRVFNKNFMFLIHSQNNFMLNIIQNTTGPGVPYTLGLVAFVIVVLHIFYAIFKILEKLFIKPESN